MDQTREGYRLLICNCPPEKASGIAENLVQERLVACANIVPGVESVYRWKGELCRDRESTLLLKTRAALVDAVTRRIVELHPYEVPEVLSVELQLAEGERRYFDWIDRETA
ncbi:MAG: divalent-cation tolerance protein CutA [Candidatus Wallbacteria bacterium]|nr:divalent-cation tolerance protein CutA [Candidatus Wallbacteria bacterium]